MANENVLVTLDKLVRYDGGIKNWIKGGIKLREKAANSGYAKTYELVLEYVSVDNGVNTLHTVSLGGDLDIPKDFFVRHAGIKTAPAGGIHGFAEGKKYIDLEISVKGYEGEALTLETSGLTNADLGKIYKYTGETDSTYVNGNFYICEADGAGYQWTPTTVSETDHVYIGLDALNNYTAGYGIDVTSLASGEIKVVGYNGITVDSNGVNVNDGNGLKINSTNQKLEVATGNGVKLELPTGAEDGEKIVAVDIDTNKALELTGSVEGSKQIAVKADATKGLAFDATNGANHGALQINADTTNGLAFDGTSGALKINTAWTATGTTSAGIYRGETSTLPTANADHAGDVYKFTGTSDGTYTNGSYYKCTESSGTYSWTEDSTGAEGSVGLMTAEDKDAIARLSAVFGNNVSIATEADIDALFPTII